MERKPQVQQIREEVEGHEYVTNSGALDSYFVINNKITKKLIKKEIA